MARIYLLHGLTLLERSGEIGKFLECVLFLVWLGIKSESIARQMCPGMLSLLVYISKTKSDFGLQWIDWVDDAYLAILGTVNTNLDDQQKRQARREGYQLERQTAAMLARRIL